MKKIGLLLSSLMILSMLLGACTPQTVEVIKTVVVEIAGTPVVQEVVKTVVVEATAVPKTPQIEIFHWWTAPGEREAADAMFAALAAKYPEVEVVENPVPGGGGTEHRIVLKARITAGIPPDTFQTLGGAELKDYVDCNVLQPLDDFYAANRLCRQDSKAAAQRGDDRRASVLRPVEHAPREHFILQPEAVRRIRASCSNRL